MIPFGQLAPDAMETAQGVAMVANNVLPLTEGYGPMPQLVTPADAEALPGAPRGMKTVVLRDGSYQVYGFTETSLYLLENNWTWTEIAAGFSCTAGDDWSAVHFGDKLLFTNTTDGLQSYDVESGGAVSYIADAGDPRFIFVASNMVVALDCKDETATRNNRLLRTSARGDQTNWKTREADYQILEDGEELVSGADLKNGAALLIQKNAIRVMQFSNAGGGATFGLLKAADGRGSVGEKSVISFDGLVYFVATDGFRRFSMDRGLEPIGAGRIDQWFFDQVAQENLSLIQGSIDPFRKVVWWRYPVVGGLSEEVFTDVIGYNWVFDRWVTGTVETSYLSSIATPGFTLPTWDDAFGTLEDSPDIGLGDRFWQGGQAVFAALDGDRKFATFSGPAMGAALRTATQVSPVSGLMTSVKPITDAPTATVQVGVSNALKDDLAWKPGVGIKPSGRAPVRARGKNMAFELDIPAGDAWTYAKGFDDFEMSGGGKR